MANLEHCKMLLLGVTVWNKWRKTNIDINPNLDGADFNGANLVGADLSYIFATGINFSKANLTGVNLIGSYLIDAQIDGAFLSSSNLKGAKLSGASLKGTDLKNSNLSGAHLKNANLSRIDLTDSIAIRANFSGADISGAKLNRADLSNCNFSNVNLSNTDLTDANLSKSSIGITNLSDSELIRTNLANSGLYKVDFTSGNLAHVNFGGAYLNEVNFSKTNLFKINFEKCKLGFINFGLTNLNSCKGLNSVLVSEPCSIDFQTLRSSKTLHKSFLKKIGLPDLYIEYLPDFYNEGLRIYPVFLSHSSKNKPFARKLYEALILNGVSVFFDEKKIKPGDDILESITKAIGHYDKMILICSKESLLENWWVDIELERIQDKERKLLQKAGKKINVLIPITIDDYIYEWEGTKGPDIRRYNIGDFKNWKNKARFDQALRELLISLMVDRLYIQPPTFLNDFG